MHMIRKLYITVLAVLSLVSAGLAEQEEADLAVSLTLALTDGSQYAFHTEIQDTPSITIDLGDTKTVERIHIRNRKGYGSRSKGITAWVSSDRAIKGEQIGMSDEVLDEYTMTLSRPQRARFITLGLQRRDYFHLQHVKIFGQHK